MKIENKNKQKTYRGYIARAGYGHKRAYARSIPASALEQMRHKPYGGDDNVCGETENRP